MKNLSMILLSLTLTTTAAARPPLPAEQYTRQSELWLARTFIGEAGWKQKRTHVGIAYVLARRWRRVVTRYPAMRFETVIKNYAHALGFRRLVPTRRQIWVRSLGDGMPEGWPRARASWTRHEPLWQAALERARKWFRGRLPDPCGGRAWNWGGTIDRELAAGKQLTPVECGDTGGTTFYDDGGSSG